MHTQPERVSMRAARLLATEYDSIVCRTDRMFAYLLLGQWVSAMVFVFLDSPMTWSGTEQRVHPHVLVAVGLGGLVTVVPSFLALARPGEKSTRYVLATAQMVWSGIFIHLGGGRVEFHFHVFGSLAFLSFYRDYRVLIPATLVTAADHFIRGIFLPESIYGIPNAQWWRAFEHSGWVVFINIFLVRNCIVAKQDLVRLCSRQASMEASQRALRGLAEGLETRVSDRTLELETAMMALEQSQADVVERREREKHSLEKSRAGLLQFLNELPMGVIIVTRAGTTYLVNDRARVILGDTAAEHLLDLAACHEEGTPRSALDGSVVEHEALQFEQIDGTRLQLHVKSVPIRGSNGQVRFGMSVFEDITERIKAQTERLHGQKLESVGQLAAGIAHEINTPMQYIGDNTEFLRTATHNLMSMLEFLETGIDKSAAPASRQRAIRAKAKTLKLDFLRERIPRAIDSTAEGIAVVRRLVGALKEFSHPGTGEKAPVDINHDIQSTIEVSRNEWKYVAELDTDFGAGLDCVPCLRSEFNQVILNILVNAAHAIADKPKEAGTMGKITVTTRLVEGYAEVRISDSGVGMPESVRAKIFDPFFTTKEVGRGSGQGLAIARSLVIEKQGGTIDVLSQVGVGTTFIVRLPLAEAGAIENRWYRSVGPGEERRNTRPKVMRKPRETRRRETRAEDRSCHDTSRNTPPKVETTDRETPEETPDRRS